MSYDSQMILICPGHSGQPCPAGDMRPDTGHQIETGHHKCDLPALHPGRHMIVVYHKGGLFWNNFKQQPRPGGAHGLPLIPENRTQFRHIIFYQTVKNHHHEATRKCGQIISRYY